MMHVTGVASGMSIRTDAPAVTVPASKPVIIHPVALSELPSMPMINIQSGELIFVHVWVANAAAVVISHSAAEAALQTKTRSLGVITVMGNVQAIDSRAGPVSPAPNTT